MSRTMGWWILRSQNLSLPRSRSRSPRVIAIQSCLGTCLVSFPLVLLVVRVVVLVAVKVPFLSVHSPHDFLIMHLSETIINSVKFKRLHLISCSCRLFLSCPKVSILVPSLPLQVCRVSCSMWFGTGVRRVLPCQVQQLLVLCLSRTSYHWISVLPL